MERASVTRRVRAFYRRRLEQYGTAYEAPDLPRPAIVFAPHFDDETLGCGGTIARKRGAGAAVSVVFMTDGRGSHPGLLPPAALTAIREHESLEALSVLGVGAAAVHCLRIPEGQLHAQSGAVVGAVRELLRTTKPREVFVPYRHEPALWSLDHRATTQIVRAALAAERADVIVYEYPIWFWLHWPWVPLRLRRGTQARAVLRQTLIHGGGLRALATLRSRVPIQDVLATKRAALDRYASQQTRLLPGVAWATLGDVADGEFLECFLQPNELFCRSQIGGA